MRGLRIGAGPLVWMLCGGCYSGVPAADLGEDVGGSSSGGPSRGHADDDGGDAGGDDSDAPAADCEGVARPSGPTQLRRLSRREYERTVAIALGVDAEAIPPFLPDERPAGFVANFAQVDPTRAQEYQTAAVAIAAATDIMAVAGCDPDAGALCAETLVQAVGPVLHRRELSPDDVQAYVQIVEDNPDATPEQAVRTALEAMLLSPSFLYHVEVGEARDEQLVLTPTELAHRLSYFAWDEPADAELREAARNGELHDPLDVATHARRLLRSPKARPLLGRFVTQWLGVDTALVEKAGLTEGLTPALADAMQTELLAFVERIVFDEGGGWQDLLLDTTTEIDATLAALYGVEAPDGGAWRPHDWDPDERRGLLSLPAILVAQAGADARVPIHQGRVVLENLLCTPVPSPPEGAVGQAPAKDPTLTEREYSEMLMEVEGCSGCHGYIEPVGWIFGHYDILGRYQTLEKGKPVDATGQIVSSSEPALREEIDGLPELSSRLADSQEFRQCMVRHAFSFVHGRAFTPSVDACAMQDADQALADADDDLVEMLVALLSSEAFATLQPMEEAQ